MAKEFSFTSLVITEPAPIIDFLFILTGAIKDVFDPIKTLSEIIVLFFFTPS